MPIPPKTSAAAKKAAKNFKQKVKSWTRGEKLAEGGFATLYLATNKDDGEEFVVKTIDRVDYEKKLALENERDALIACHSPYIVKCLGWDVTKQNVTKQADVKLLQCNLFLEFVPRGTILDHVNRNGGSLEEPIIAAYTRDILKGLHYLHQRRIIHGDLKCSNLLVAPKNIKLCDLGSAKFMDKGDLVVSPRPGEGNRNRIFVTGTNGFMAPEVEDELRQDYASDIYSLGCAIVEMTTGDPPEKDPALYGFEGESDDEDNACTIDIPPNFSKLCRQFVELCLTLDPDERPGTEELLDHPWIVNAPPYPAHKPRKANRRTESAMQNMSKWMGCGPSSENSVLSCLKCASCACVAKAASKDDMYRTLLPKRRRNVCTCWNVKNDGVRRRISHLT